MRFQQTQHSMQIKENNLDSIRLIAIFDCNKRKSRIKNILDAEKGK